MILSQTYNITQAEPNKDTCLYSILQQTYSDERKCGNIMVMQL